MALVHSLAPLGNFLRSNNSSAAGSIQLVVVMLFNDFHMGEIFSSFTGQLHHYYGTQGKVRRNEQGGIVGASQRIHLLQIRILKAGGAHYRMHAQGQHLAQVIHNHIRTGKVHHYMGLSSLDSSHQIGAYRNTLTQSNSTLFNINSAN